MSDSEGEEGLEPEGREVCAWTARDELANRARQAYVVRKLEQNYPGALRVAPFGAPAENEYRARLSILRVLEPIDDLLGSMGARLFTAPDVVSSSTHTYLAVKMVRASSYARLARRVQYAAIGVLVATVFIMFFFP